MISVRKYQMFRLLGCKDIRICKYEFVTKTQFLSLKIDFEIRLFLVCRYCNPLQQQVCSQHWIDVVVLGQGGSKAQGIHL